MKYIFSIIFINLILIAEAQINIEESAWMNDTINLNSSRVIYKAPEITIRLSIEYIAKGEGISLFLPLNYTVCDTGKVNIEALFIEQIVNTSYERIKENENIDYVLWNTFNSNNKGSKCYVSDNLYYRFDVLPSGVVVYYEGLSLGMSMVADKIIKSITTESLYNVQRERTKIKRKRRYIE